MNTLPLAGWALFLSILAALLHGFFHISALPAAVLQLAAALLLLSRVSPMVRLQSLLLAAVGGLALHFSGAGAEALLASLSRNQGIIAMLAVVGFLRLVPLQESDAPLPSGRRALWKTLFGVHWLASVTNFSALVLFGDHLADENRLLQPAQATLLARGFALAALWSPFYVAMGVALGEAPGAHVSSILLWGLPISQLLLALLAWSLGRSADFTGFTGYPFTPANLVGPAFLILSVFVGHLLLPATSIVCLVTAAIPLYALIACRRQAPLSLFARHIRQELPRMGAEVLLFLAAGILGAGFTQLILHHSLPLPAAGTGALAAAIIGLAVIILLASAGIHPVVGITAVGTVLAHAGISPDLLALTFLMGWGLGVIINPISGTNLLLAGRYRYPLSKVWRLNTVFVACAYLACCGWLFLYTRLG